MSVGAIRDDRHHSCALTLHARRELRRPLRLGDDVQEERHAGGKTGPIHLRTLIGKVDADLASNSPDRLADQFGAPVLLAYGEDHERAPFAQAKAMRAALDTAQRHCEWLGKPGDARGFSNEKSVARLHLTQ